MKMHSTFHVSLLLFSKHDLIEQQVPELLSVIVESEEGLYFVDSIDDMRWQIQEAQFELLIKWKEYKWRTWKLYTTIKKDTLILIKKFHEDHFSQSASTKWTKDENRQSFSDKQTAKLTEITTSTLIEMKIQSLTWIMISITHIWRNWMNELQIFFLKEFLM